MFTYKDKEYSSKAEVVRELYDQGKVSFSVPDKKRVADELGMTVQTVHATLTKYVGNSKPSGAKLAKKEKVTSTVVDVPADLRLNQRVGRVRSTDGPIFISDKDIEVQAELMKDKHKVPILFAPNQWGMPTSIPPLYVIDPNYDPDWMPPPEETVEKSW